MKWYISVYFEGNWHFVGTYWASSSNYAIEAAQKEHPEYPVYKLLDNWKAETD